jgi:hypothetical protein
VKCAKPNRRAKLSFFLDDPSYGQSARVKDERFPQFSAAALGAPAENRLPRSPALPVATRSLTRSSNARSLSFVFETKEVHMDKIIDIHAEIAELSAELKACILTRKERAETLRRLDAAMAEAERRGRDVENEGA